MGVVGDGRPLGRQVDGGLGDTLYRGNGLLDPSHAGRAVHPVYRDLDGVAARQPVRGAFFLRILVRLFGRLHVPAVLVLVHLLALLV